MAGDTGREKITVEHESIGHDQVAAGFKKIADAQRDATDAVKEGAQASPTATGPTDAAPKIKETAQATEELESAEQDLKDVLNEINPALGGMLDAMGGAMNLAGALANKKLDLAGTIGKVTSHIKGNVAAYGLLAAGSIAFAAISGIVEKWRELKREAAEARDAVAEYVAIQSKLQGERTDLRAQVVAGLIAQGKAAPEAADEAML